ncbi:hypothetical protein ACVWYF_000667 [Hymenobacter sp. UYAg731]
MTTQEVKQTLKNLEQKMHGHNCEVHFGIEVLDNCMTIGEACRKLSVKYSDTRIYEVKPRLIDEPYLWDSIGYGFAYRGDDAAGLKLTGKQEKSLSLEVKKYELLIRQYLTKTTELFSYPDESGVPYVFVFWGYSFILFNVNEKPLFIYSLSSD